MDGILLIDKISGLSSFDVVRLVRKRADTRKVGHAGTLDPLASGLLVVCIGQATKLVPYLMDGEKRYEVCISLGEETDTLDADGTVVRKASVPELDESAVLEALGRFVGVVAQVPPKYSALKRNGETLYRKARRGEAVVLKPREVTIDAIELLEMSLEQLILDVRCGKGTYIRSLARDITIALGTVGHVTALRRTAASGFCVEEAVSFETLRDADFDITTHLLPLAKGVSNLAAVTIDAAREKAVRFGQIVSLPEDASSYPIADETVALLSESGKLVCIAKRQKDRLKPIRVF